ncbi:DUF3301 domain-containing protein [Dyella sp.]|uniref:DUF3301 domain-containing protein n=1 Tax=Dyella sp. TaxID=1869338 RepID=UPI002ED3B623
MRTSACHLLATFRDKPLKVAKAALQHPNLTPTLGGMGTLSDLLSLLALLAIVGSWLKFHRARDRATGEARRQCERYGLQLLDETVGLRRIRFLRVDGRLSIERCYAFDVSIDGDDREPGQLWLIGDTMTSLSLPTVQLQIPESRHAVLAEDGDDNILPFRPRDRHLH